MAPRCYIPNTVQVAVGIRWTVIVDHDVDTLHIDTTTEDIRCDEDSLLERLESGIPVDSGAHT